MTGNRFSVSLVVCLATLAAWGYTSSRADSSGSSSTADGMVWRESETGLCIGILLSEEVKNAAVPALDVYLKNHGSNEVTGVIQSTARFIVELNGEFFAIEDFGGKSSYMPPGRVYGPLKIDLAKFWKIPKLTFYYTVEPNNSHPVLRMGKNMLRVHYKVEDKLIPSGELTIEK